MIKFNSVQGRLYRVERTQNALGNWESEDHNIPLPAKFVADLDNMMIGPIAFLQGRPDVRMVRLADVENGDAEIPERPTPDHKIGFVIRVYSRTLGMREWRGLQKCVLNVMDGVYDRFKTSPEMKQGLLPVLEISDVVAVKREGNFPGIDMTPVIKIDQWVPRPKDLVPPSINAVERVAITSQPQQPAAQPVQPAPQPFQQPIERTTPRRAPPPPTRPSGAQSAATVAYLAPSSPAPIITVTQAPPPMVEAVPWDDDDAEFK